MVPGDKSELDRKLVSIRREAEERDALRRAETRGIPYVDLRKVPISMDAIERVSEKEAKEAEVMPIQFRAHELALAVFDSDHGGTKALIERLQKEDIKVKLFIASLSGLTEVWRNYEFASKDKKKITGAVEISKEELARLLEELKTVNAVQKKLESSNFERLSTTVLLEIVLAGALSTRASDIHFEAGEKDARIRFRVDGVLHDVTDNLPIKNYGTLLSRVKLLGGMKINIHGEAQDGRFTIHLADKETEVRASIIPSEYGETVVLRILDPDAIGVNLPELGFRKDDLVLVEKELRRPNGLILNTGPTGSGKTTTLYAFLKKITNPEIKIITIEDPIEYRLGGIEQTQVDTDAGYTFPKGLRAIVRQDPDVVLVGEVRDFETADIALQASLTGHLVFSTIHANEALGAVPRLVNLGVKAETIGPALNLIIAQRLVRVLCPQCKVSVPSDGDQKTRLEAFIGKLPTRVDRTPYSASNIHEAKGCEACGGSGYRGRKGIFEFFRGGPEFSERVLKGASEVDLQELARKQEMVTMQEDGILKVLEGITTFNEVEKVTGPIEWGA